MPVKGGQGYGYRIFRGNIMAKDHLIVSAILLALLNLFSGCGRIEPGNSGGETVETVTAEVAVVKAERSANYYEAVGTIKAQTASTLSGKILGTIKTVNVREGDHVTKGQVLILIDDRQVDSQLKQAKAAMAEARGGEAASASARDAAKAGAELAQVTYKRYLKLKEDNAASLQEFDQIEMRSRQADAALKQAEATLEAAGQRVKQTEAAVASAEISRKDAVISAPFDGIVTARMVDVGDLSSPGTPLMDIEKTGSLEVEAIIPEEYIGLVMLQQGLDVTVPALQDVPFEGRVKSIITAADPKSRTFIVKAALPEVAGMHSGMFARINMPKGDEDMVLIPSSAVVLQGQLTGVFILDEENKARFRIIRTGRKTGMRVEVISGMKDGVRYVVSPQVDLKDGMKVEESS
jgi:RND family efflux transporter MFP subunit